MPAPITADLTAWWINPAEGAAPVRLIYDPAVPMAVAIVFPHLPAGYGWEWHRDTLRDALTGPAGTGDVLMWRDGELVKIWLRAAHPGDDDAIIALGRREVARFLARTERLVPYGTETVPGLDAGLTALLGGTP